MLFRDLLAGEASPEVMRAGIGVIMGAGESSVLRDRAVVLIAFVCVAVKLFLGLFS